MVKLASALQNSDDPTRGLEAAQINRADNDADKHGRGSSRALSSRNVFGTPLLPSLVRDFSYL